MLYYFKEKGGLNMDYNYSSQDLSGDYETKAVIQDEDGNYHWVSTFSMWKNPSMIRPILKVFGIFFLIFLAVVMVVCFQSEKDMGELVSILLIYLGIVLMVLLIIGLSYALVAFLYGGKYVSFYEMNSEGLSHYQPSGQADKEKAIGLFTAAAGLMGNNPGVSIAGLTAGSRLVVRAEFSKVKSLKIISDKDEIRVHSFMTWHTVHVPRQSFEFVADYMVGHCTNAKVKIC